MGLTSKISKVVVDRQLESTNGSSDINVSGLSKQILDRRMQNIVRRSKDFFGLYNLVGLPDAANSKHSQEISLVIAKVNVLSYGPCTSLSNRTNKETNQ